MLRTSMLTAVGFLAVAGAAFAGPAKPHAAWASGRIARVDSAARSVVVTQGAHEMTFVLAANAQLVQGGATLSPGDLDADVGRAVKVRYLDGRWQQGGRPDRGGPGAYDTGSEGASEAVAPGSVTENAEP